jgi:hypothetical protein
MNIPTQLIQAMVDKGFTNFNYHGNMMAVTKKGLVAADLTTTGYVLIGDMLANFGIVPVGFMFVVNSAAITGLTTLRLSTSDATPVDIATLAVADLTSGSKHVAATANVTLGAGFLAPGNPGKGLVVRRVGSAAAGAFTLDVVVFFTLKG